jgi:predicted O-linked N-acetylglucosamine transferase (SPINDLY family)
MSTPPSELDGATFSALLQKAQAARNASNWPLAITLYAHCIKASPQLPELHHNLALCLFGAGRSKEATLAAVNALKLKPQLWQSKIVLARAAKSLGQMDKADLLFAEVLAVDPNNAAALAGRADLAMNEFGDPLEAMRLVRPLWQDPVHRNDAELTTLMASLYDRDIDAATLTAQVRDFSRRALRLPQLQFAPRPARAANARPRVALLSPLFCVSPVYFLTIAGFRHVAKGCEVVVFNRGAKRDWATDAFAELASEWTDVQHLSAEQLAQAIYNADIDVLYDLGGWMDPVGLQALSAKPARQQFKWVGGQSITTGLDSFDGWIGDAGQSPIHLQHLYSEPLWNVEGGYAIYTPPAYMPKPAATKSEVPAIFANPAKLSRAFLHMLAQMPGKKCFIHRQYRHPRVRQRIESVLDASQVEYVHPGSHQEALEALNQHKLMIDTFPYSGGLTAREARALGLKVQTRVGELFCERHGAELPNGQ